MTERKHHLKVGQIVEILPSTRRYSAPGHYEIVRLVPCDSGDPQYCLRSRQEKHERIVAERDLVHVPEIPTE